MMTTIPPMRTVETKIFRYVQIVRIIASTTTRVTQLLCRSTLVKVFEPPYLEGCQSAIDSSGDDGAGPHLVVNWDHPSDPVEADAELCGELGRQLFSYPWGHGEGQLVVLAAL